MVPALMPASTNAPVRSVPDVVDGDCTRGSLGAEQLWRSLAPGLAGRPVARVSKYGNDYRARDERPLTSSRPTAPAAVMVYSFDGFAKAIFLDLDSSRGGREQVDADADAIRSWLIRAGALWVEDISPNGGRHLYIPLQTPAHITDARPFIEALALRYPSLDASPHRSVRSGCCRVPGSTHKTKGFQTLTQPLGEAIEAVTTGNPHQVWESLWNDTSTERSVLSQQTAALSRVETDTDTEPPTASQDHTQAGPLLSSRMQRIAIDGDWTGYHSPSEARQAVLTAAARTGLSLTYVHQQILSGYWPGLKALYSKYTPHQASQTLKREWNKASTLVKNTPHQPPMKSPHRYDTSNNKSQGGRTHHEEKLAAWDRQLSHFEARLPETQDRNQLRIVLRGLREAAGKTGSLETSFGVRSLAQATGLHPGTVANHLNTLAAMQEALIARTMQGRGTDADTWTLVTKDTDPAQHPRPRRAHALRPAFRELGIPAAFTYETLETATEPLTTTEIASHALIGRSTAEEALQTLAAFGLATRTTNGTWVKGKTSLTHVAGLLGVTAAIAAQLELHRAQRAAWHARLSQGKTTNTQHSAVESDYPWWTYEPDPHPDQIPPQENTPAPPLGSKALTTAELHALAEAHWAELHTLENTSGAGAWERAVTYACALTLEKFATTPDAFQDH